MKRHWSFVVCDPKYLYPLALLLVASGVSAAFAWSNPAHLNRIGNLVIGAGVWMSMRHTLREGLSRYKNIADSSPVVRGTNQPNPTFFNKAAFAIGDANLQLHGFALVVLGSVLGSFGDLILLFLFPRCF